MCINQLSISVTKCSKAGYLKKMEIQNPNIGSSEGATSLLPATTHTLCCLRAERVVVVHAEGSNPMSRLRDRNQGGYFHSNMLSWEQLTPEVTIILCKGQYSSAQATKCHPLTVLPHLQTPRPVFVVHKPSLSHTQVTANVSNM